MFAFTFPAVGLHLYVEIPQQQWMHGMMLLLMHGWRKGMDGREGNAWGQPLLLPAVCCRRCSDPDKRLEATITTQNSPGRRADIIGFQMDADGRRMSEYGNGSRWHGPSAAKWPWNVVCYLGKRE